MTVTTMSSLMTVVLVAMCWMMIGPLAMTSAAPVESEAFKMLRQAMLQPCQARNITTYVHRKGCHSAPVANKFCGGLCTSITYPQDDHKEWTNACSACRPTKIESKRVLMYCPDHKKKYKHKTVYVIADCQCKIDTCSVPQYVTTVKSSHKGDARATDNHRGL